MVDDGSTDATPDLLDEIARADPRVRVLRQPNGGIVDALNHGLAHCRGEFVARHDADDRADPDRLARQHAYLTANPDCVAVGSAARHIDAEGRPLGTVTRTRPPGQADPYWAPSREPYLLHPFLMARRDVLQSIGGYRHAFHAEDTDLYWRLMELGRLHHMEEILGEYRLHVGSVSACSIRNGRIAALYSQLAGLSARRRRQGRPDLAFPGNRVAAEAAAGSLQAVFNHGREGLDRDEADFLEIALAAKLVEQAFYRPYELDATDCGFVAAAVRRHRHILTPANRMALDWLLAGRAAHLARKGMLHEARLLIRPRLYPTAAAKLAAHTVLPYPAVTAARRVIGRMRRSVRSA